MPLRTGDLQPIPPTSGNARCAMEAGAAALREARRISKNTAQLHAQNVARSPSVHEFGLFPPATGLHTTSPGSILVFAGFANRRDRT